MSELTESDLEGLTDEELLAISDEPVIQTPIVEDEPAPIVAEDDKPIVPDDKPIVPNDTIVSDDKPIVPDEPIVPDDKPIVPDDKPEVVAKKVPDEFVGKLESGNVDDLADKITSIDEDIEKIGNEMHEGDIDLQEYHVKMNKLSNDRTILAIEHAQSEFVAKNNASLTEQRWTWDRDRFFEMNTSYEENPAAYAAFSSIVNTVLATNEYVDRSGADVLAEADRQYKSLFAPEPVKPDVPETPSVKPVLKVVKIPKTLGGMPAASSADADEGGEFAAIDKLDGMELEEAMARLTPEQSDRYAAS